MRVNFAFTILMLAIFLSHRPSKKIPTASSLILTVHTFWVSYRCAFQKFW